MQYTAIFHGRKNDNFRLKSFDYFHIFAQNIDCGYTFYYIKVVCKGVYITRTCFHDVRWNILLHRASKTNCLPGKLCTYFAVLKTDQKHLESAR